MGQAKLNSEKCKKLAKFIQLQNPEIHPSYNFNDFTLTNDNLSLN